MEVDLAVNNASSSGSVPESRAGSGTVPSGLHFSKTKPAPSSDTANVDKVFLA
jgi:hypothetical protein